MSARRREQEPPAPAHGWGPWADRSWTFHNRPLAWLHEQDEVDSADAAKLAETYPDLFALPRYFDGDTLIDASNRRVWATRYKDLKGKNWWPVPHGLLVRLDTLTQEQRRALDGLEQYALLDEEDFSLLEQEAIDKAWEDDGRADVKRDLISRAVIESYASSDALEELLDGIPDKTFDSIYWAWSSEHDKYPDVRGAGDVGFQAPQSKGVTATLKALALDPNVNIELRPSKAAGVRAKDLPPAARKLTGMASSLSMSWEKAHEEGLLDHPLLKWTWAFYDELDPDLPLPDSYYAEEGRRKRGAT